MNVETHSKKFQQGMFVDAEGVPGQVVDLLATVGHLVPEVGLAQLD
jgi:hypothetical protein